MECAILSNMFIPKNQYEIQQTKVKVIYIEEIIKVTSRVFGNIFSAVSEFSILNNCMPPIFNKGSMVIAITIIPIPPSHCKIALHIKMLLGELSRSVIMVDPVVVIPDMLSKKESTIDRLRSDNKKGIHPKIAILNHDKVVSKKACCKFSFLFSSRFVSTRSIPINAVIDADDKNMLFFSPYIN